MNCWIKEDVQGDLSVPMRKGHGIVVKLYYSKGLDFFVTSRREGIHSPGSLHPDGNAEDFRGQGVPILEIKLALPSDYDIVQESDHYHLEYDPKEK